MDSHEPDGSEGVERSVYFFGAYVRVEATSEEEAGRRILSEPTYVAESDTADGPNGVVQLILLDVEGAYPVVDVKCICPPELVARGGFKSGCPVHA